MDGHVSQNHPPDGPMRAVMLAAGDGGRLGERTRSLPKPLVPLNGRPLVYYTLDALHSAGVTDLVVVTGYRGAQVQAALREGIPVGLRIRFVTNERFEGHASLSLRAARPLVAREPVLLVMSDHLLSAELLTRLLAGASGYTAVAADASTGHDPIYMEEATKLEVADGRVRAIGKGLRTWHALDAGAFVLAPSAWRAVDAAPEDCELSVIMALLADEGDLLAVDVSGASWYDIDTEDDLLAASRLLAGRSERRVEDALP
jgi:choline kinase